jgi:hypothetical protein
MTTVIKEDVLALIDEFQRGTRRPKILRGNLAELRVRVAEMPAAPDQNWVPVKEGKPKDTEFRWLTVHSKLVKGYWDPHAKIFRDMFAGPLYDVTAWYKDPKPYPYGGFKRK